MQQVVVIRLLGEELVWYPPDCAGEALLLADSNAVSRLHALAASRRALLVFAVPGADVVLREVAFGAGERRHIVGSLPFLLEEEFAADIETLHFASQALSGSSLAVATCASACMYDWRRRLENLPELPRWIPEPLLLPWQPGELCLLAEPESVVVRDGACSGFSIERALAPMLLSQLAESREYDRVILYGQNPAPDQALLPASLQDRLQWRTGNFFSALMLSGANRQSLNLRQGDFGSSLPLGQWWRQWRVAAALFAAAFCLQLMSTWADYSQLQSANLELRRQVENAYRSAVPKGAVVDAEKQLQRKLAEARGGGAGPGFVSLVDKIGRVVSGEQGARLTSINFNDKVGDVRLNLIAPDFRAVETIRRGMEQLGLEAQLENSNTRGAVVRARFKVREKRA